MNSSPERNTFQNEKYIKRCEEQGKEPSKSYIAMHKQHNIDKCTREADTEWQKNNLEYDLRSTKWICDKAKAREEYAQNIYAALCNQDWQRNDVWPLLKGETWGCSWRYAGGVVADMLESGDYIDWYCSGIRSTLDKKDLEDMTDEQIKRSQWMEQHFVGEGHVTDEIRKDFFKLGWIPVDQVNDE